MDELHSDLHPASLVIGKRCILCMTIRNSSGSYLVSKDSRELVLMSRAIRVARTANKAAINNRIHKLGSRIKITHPQAVSVWYDRGLQTLLIFPKGLTEEEVLADLDERQHELIPQTIWIAVLASIRYVESPIPVRDSIGALQDLVYEETIEKTSTLTWTQDKKQIDNEYAAMWMENIIRHGQLPSTKNGLRPGAIAGVTWIACRYVWDFSEIHNLINLNNKSDWLVTCLGTLFEMITGCPIKFRGVSVQPRIFLDSSYPYDFLDLWLHRMCLQYAAVNPSPDTTRHLFPKGIPNLIAQDKLATISTPLSLESVQAILKEGEERRVYPTPEGGRGYIVDIPFDPIREIFSECRIWHTKIGRGADLVYCILDGEYGGVFFAVLMDTEHLEFVWKNNHAAFDVITTMVVGIWRDLVGEGEEVFPAYEDEAESDEPVSYTPRPYKPSVHNPDRIVYLPRSRYVRWGPAGERKYILRRARRGSMIEAKAINLTRSGRRPSLKQMRLAEEYGITLPPGWTFRKEHWRGPRQEGEEERPKVIKCRGLSTVAYLLGDLLKGE